MKNVSRSIGLMSLLILLSTAFLPRAEAVTASRDESLRAGHVWIQPTWIAGDPASGFQFDQNWNFESGPPIETGEEVLKKPVVDCEMTQKSVSKVSTGWTAKFYCEISELISKPLVKVKYLFSDGEVAGEILGSRLLWALGFASDRMYLYERVNCFGCTENPHQDRRIDSTTLKSPRAFEMAALERKLNGAEIKIADSDSNGEVIEGFSFEELLKKVPRSGPERLREQTEREALKLLAVFMRHSDNKPGNQAVVCSGKTTLKGGCDGDVTLYIHDVGLTFGSGFYDDWKASKAIFEHWDQARIWKTPSKCIGEIGLSSEGAMEEPVIREEGRKFLVQLLRGFTKGADGRKRVKTLFRAARADQRYGSIQQWTNTFYRKIDELEYPLGKSRSEFSCPEKFRSN